MDGLSSQMMAGVMFGLRDGLRERLGDSSYYRKDNAF